jgi:FKBP-type peptidyl-prolyl cis-trans isomerase FkpA
MCFFQSEKHIFAFRTLSLNMKNFRSLLLFVLVAAGLASCKKSNEDNFDYVAQFTADTTAIRAYIVKNNIPAIKHESGIFYQIIAPGAGSLVYNANTTVKANYAGRLLGSTTTFDKTNGTPASFALGRVIAGWQIGVPLIQKGGSIRLMIPSYYGYGNANTGAIPANSILDFDIELVDATNSN